MVIEDIILLLISLTVITQVVVPAFLGSPFFPFLRPSFYRDLSKATAKSYEATRLKEARKRKEEAQMLLDAQRLETEAAKLRAEAAHEMEKTLDASISEYLPQITTGPEAPIRLERHGLV